MNHGETDGAPFRGRAFRRRLTRPPVLLLIALLAFIAVVTGLAELRALELTTTTWDLGIYQQALSSAAHGGTFYEAPDVETGGPASFLQIHSSFVLYALVPIYSLAPVALTLFLVQSTVVAVAALPLYGLTRALTGSDRRALALGLLYLGGAPIIASSLYDFHAESFVPVVLFSVAYCWQQRHYRWGAFAAGIGFLSLEVIPVLLFALAVFFLSLEWTELAEPPDTPRGAIAEWIRRAQRLVTDRRGWPTWGLLLASIAAYYLLLALRLHFLSEWFGFPAFPTRSVGYVIGGDPSSLGLSLGHLWTGFFDKTSYWILLVAFVGGLPLWFRRTWILAAPWVAFTFLTAFLNFTVLGFQYGFVAAAPLYLGAAWGLTRFRWPAIDRPAPAPDVAARPKPLPWARRPRPTTAALVLLLALNIAFTPIDPLMSNAAPGAAYNLTLANPIPLAGVQEVLALVPANAEVLASYDIFPLLANDLNAYTMFWGPNPNLDLPFNLTHLPDYVVISEDRFYTAPPWLTDTLYVPGDFGLRAVAWATPVGPVALFEHGYAGPTATWGSAQPFPVTISSKELALTGNMKLVPNASAPSGTMALSVNGATGELFQTDGIDFPNGTYRISYSVRAYPFDRSVPPGSNEVVFTAVAVPFAQPGQAPASATYGEIGGSDYVTVIATLVVSEPMFNAVLVGFSSDGGVAIQIADIDIVQLA